MEENLIISVIVLYSILLAILGYRIVYKVIYPEEFEDNDFKAEQGK